MLKSDGVYAGEHLGQPADLACAFHLCLCLQRLAVQQQRGPHRDSHCAVFRHQTLQRDLVGIKQQRGLACADQGHIQLGRCRASCGGVCKTITKIETVPVRLAKRLHLVVQIFRVLPRFGHLKEVGLVQHFPLWQVDLLVDRRPVPAHVVLKEALCAPLGAEQGAQSGNPAHEDGRHNCTNR